MTTLDLVAGCLIVGFVVILLIYFLLKLKKKEPFSPAEKQMPFFIMGALLIYVVLLAIRYSTGISNTDRLQILLQLGLVTITAVYAWSARQQSEANAKMAEEAREQRILASRPYILIGTVRKKDIEGGSPSFSHFEVFNTGSGPAIEVELAITGTDGKLNSHQVRTTFLRSQGEPMTFHPADLALLKARTIDNLSYTTYYCVCEYRGVLSDVGKKTWYQTWLPFEILIPFTEGRKAGEMTVTAGELQFKEVTEQDRINAFRRSKPPFDDVKLSGETITIPIKDNSGTTE